MKELILALLLAGALILFLVFLLTRQHSRQAVREDPRTAVRRAKEEDAAADHHFDKIEEYRNDFA